MRRHSRLIETIAGSAIALAALATVPRAHAQYAVFDADAALNAYHERVESYAALHRRLAPPPPAMAGSDPISKLLGRQYLAAAVRGARRYARQGDIFAPEIAPLFRWMLADAIGEVDGEGFLATLNGGEWVPRGMHPTVNEPYLLLPVHRLPPEIRLGLPPIPAELDYRIAGHDLVLWDIYAGIVVDFVPDAITSHTSTE